MFSRPEGGFANLTGSATQGRQQLLIDDAPPPERPQRRPLRDQQTPAAPAPTAGAAQDPAAANAGAAQDPAAGVQDPAQAPAQAPVQ